MENLDAQLKVEIDHKIEEIIVNAMPKPWHEGTISYKQVVILEYGAYDENPDIVYHVSYTKGVDKKPDGVLDKGDSVRVKNKMRFLVTKTDRS